MVKNNESKVEITKRNIKYYIDKGHDCNVGDVIIMNIYSMPKMSHNRVIAICEICNLENELPFSKYNRNKDRRGFYSCKKCSNIKRQKTNLENFGVENFSQLEKVKESKRIWMTSDEFKKKSKNTILDKSGVDSYSKTEEFKELISDFHINNQMYLREKRESTCLEKYGYKSILEIPEFKENAMFEKYGTSYSLLVPEIREKIQNANLEKFGHISPFGNKEVQEKSIKKVIELYGVDNVWKSNKLKEQLSIIRYNKFPNIELKKIEKYRRRVRYLTNKIKKDFIDTWNGLDFYDNEYIKDNFNLDKNDPKYPTIDHKISIFYGFINNISIEEISKLENLCFTKRILNLKKNSLIEKEFKETSI